MQDHEALRTGSFPRVKSDMQAKDSITARGS